MADPVVEAALDLMERWRPIMWAEENAQIEKSVGPFLTKRQIERRLLSCYRKQFSSALNKATKAQSIRGRMAMGKVYLPKRAPWVTALVSELLRFPAGRNDDQVDVLSLVGRMLDELVRGEVPKAEEPFRGLNEMTMDEVWEKGRPPGFERRDYRYRI